MKYAKRWKRWSAKEEQFLRDNYSSLSKKSLKDVLQRPWSGIEHKAFKLNLSRSRVIDDALRSINAKPMKLNNFQKGLIIGLIEGEGYVGIAKYENTFYPVLSVANTRPEIISKIREILKSGFKVSYHDTKKPRHKPYLYLVLKDKAKIKSLFSAIHQHMISKRLNVELALSFIDTWERMILESDSQKKKEYNTQLLCMRNRMKELNKKGI